MLWSQQCEHEIILRTLDHAKLKIDYDNRDIITMRYCNVLKNINMVCKSMAYILFHRKKLN